MLELLREAFLAYLKMKIIGLNLDNIIGCE